MKPRALLIDLFGDYLRYRGGQARLRELTALLECFDVGASTARVTLARLRKDGWFETIPEGREVSYRLTEKSWHILDEGRVRILDRADGEWGGVWHMVIYYVPEAERTVRERLRRELAWLGFGPLAASTWLSPHDRLVAVEEKFGGTPAMRLDLLRARSRGLTYDRDMAERCWDLPGLNADYRDFLDRYRAQMPRFRAGRIPPRDALIERTRLIHEYRRFPFRDPDLPEDLLPPRWRGREAHEMFLEARELLREAAEAQVDAIMSPP
ncbi:PaaX family transcriptional regulator C-terminal domain-containing protein [Georgenia yuyongxinii]|uniref:PaaX family transcriptional regulator n=1 Tax=Georgenia yuyongxinii TaxID=2589797 RepID=A0A552WSK7_9MICO|nr:PaaX family transcriptional regulator C-terminal domain-containing protein [Georgenia yuyongxinii]TRW45820.1 PaaX family transcriptional regulator [Georgenia yuyongxinii]